MNILLLAVNRQLPNSAIVLIGYLMCKRDGWEMGDRGRERPEEGG